MSEKDRQKASDVFRETNYVFSKKVSFEEAFPEIEDIKVEVIESEGFEKIDFDNSLGYNPMLRIYSKSVGEYIDCHNLMCYNGGFSLGSITRAMVREKQTFKQDSAICQGYEGSPKGKRRYRSCLHRFHYRINIKYKETKSEQTA